MTYQRDSKLEKLINARLELGPSKEVVPFCYEQVCSVLDVAKDSLSNLEPGKKALVLARSQSAGRGQHGRSWVAVEEAFLGCLLIPECKISKNELPAFSLVIAIKIAQILSDYEAIVGVKWPNDVLSRNSNKKISGVLLESGLSNQTLKSNLRIGIGVNIVGSPDGGTSLQEETGKSVDMVDFAVKITESCILALALFEQNGFSYFENEWKQFDLLDGNLLNFKHAEKIISGFGAGVDRNGFLLIDVDGKIQSFNSGQVLL